MAKDKGIAGHRRVAVAKLAGVFDFGRNLGERFDQVFADHRRVQRRPAAGQNHAADIAQLRRRHVQPAELGGAFFVAEPPAHRVADGTRLLKDFLEHVVRIVALLDVGVAEFDFA